MDEEQLGQLIGSGVVAFMGVILLCALAVAVLTIAGMWKAFEKAGKPGWAAIIPIYNLIVMLEITGRPLWWIFFFLIPLVNIGFAVVMNLDFAKSYGQGAGFGLGLMFLGFIFFPILGFGDSRYVGPAAAPGNFTAPGTSNS